MTEEPLPPPRVNWDRLVALGKDMVSEHGTTPPIFFVEFAEGDEVWQSVLEGLPESAEERIEAFAGMGSETARTGPTPLRTYLVVDTWTAPTVEGMRPQDNPERHEAVLVEMQDSRGGYRMVACPYHREPGEGGETITFGPDEESSTEKHENHLLDAFWSGVRAQLS